MRNMKAKEDLLKMASEDYRKKRGRPRKDEYDFKHDVSSMKGEFVLGSDNGVSKSVATTQVRVLVRVLIFVFIYSSFVDSF